MNEVVISIEVLVNMFSLTYWFTLQELCLWCLYQSCHTSVTPPYYVPPRQTRQTSAGPGGVWPDPGCIRWCGRCHHSWAGVVMVQKEPELHARSSGSCARPAACHTWCVCSSSVCFCPWCSWSSAMAKSCSLSKGWAFKFQVYNILIPTHEINFQNNTSHRFNEKIYVNHKPLIDTICHWGYNPHKSAVTYRTLFPINISTPCFHGYLQTEDPALLHSLFIRLILICPAQGIRAKQTG